jgi:DNA polymerase-3 subunit delta
MILFIHGTDTFRSRQFLQESITDFKKKRDPRGFNTAILSAAKEKPEKIMSEILTMPFLAEKRMVVVENILSLSDKKFLGELIDKIKNKRIPEECVVVFWQGELIGKTTEAKELFGILAKQQFVYLFDLLPPHELNKWISKEIIKRGGSIGQAGANYLATNIGSDMWLLNSLMDQLIAYTDGREILIEDIKMFLSEKIDDNIFNAIETIIGGNKKMGFRLLNEQRRLGQDDGYLFAMILRQFKILLQIRDLWEQNDNMPSDIMAKILGLHPFVVKKTLPMTKKYSLTQLKNIYKELLEIDIATKTGSGMPGVMIDCLVGRI